MSLLSPQPVIRNQPKSSKWIITLEFDSTKRSQIGPEHLPIPTYLTPLEKSNRGHVIRPRVLEPTILRANLTIPVPVQLKQRSIAVIHTHINPYIARCACEGS